MALLHEQRGSEGAGAPSAEDRAAFWRTLVARIAQGDAAAEDQLVRWFHPRVRLIASGRLHNADTAQDVAQDTIVAVLKAIRAGDVREPAHLPAFVFGIATNLINNRHRTTKQRREVQMVVPDPPSDADTVVTELDFAQRRTLVRQALLQLDAIDRAVLILSMVDGLKPREIAPRVGLTPSVVRTRKTRAIKAMTEAVRAVGDTKRPASPLMNTKARGETP